MGGLDSKYSTGTVKLRKDSLSALLHTVSLCLQGVVTYCDPLLPVNNSVEVSSSDILYEHCLLYCVYSVRVKYLCPLFRWSVLGHSGLLIDWEINSEISSSTESGVWCGPGAPQLYLLPLSRLWFQFISSQLDNNCCEKTWYEEWQTFKSLWKKCEDFNICEKHWQFKSFWRNM